MEKSLHIVHIKKPCRIQIIFGLCLTMLFTFLCNNNIIFATDYPNIEGLYPIKQSKVLTSSGVYGDDRGFSRAEFTIIESDVSNSNYYDLLFELVDEALLNVQNYFSFTLDEFVYDKIWFKNALLSGDGYNGFSERDIFYNVYCVVNGTTPTIYFQPCISYTGISSSSVLQVNQNLVGYHLDSSLNFYYASEYNNSRGFRDCIFRAAYNSGNIFNFYPVDNLGTKQNIDSSILSTNYSFSDVFNNLRSDIFSNLFLSKYQYNSNQFEASFSLVGDYIIPLYLDCDIYNQLSFFIPNYNGSDDLYGNISDYNNKLYYYYTPAVDLTTYYSYFDPSYWYAGKYMSGIKANIPDPIITPIPTFGPIYTPTPFPTLNITATLTPIAIPNDPIITSGLGDPVSVVYGIIGYLTQVLSLSQIKFISTTVQYIYNSNIFFQILMFLIPGIILLTFMIGRLKRK